MLASYPQFTLHMARNAVHPNSAGDRWGAYSCTLCGRRCKEQKRDPSSPVKSGGNNRGAVTTEAGLEGWTLRGRGVPEAEKQGTEERRLPRAACSHTPRMTESRAPS